MAARILLLCMGRYATADKLSAQLAGCDVALLRDDRMDATLSQKAAVAKVLAAWINSSDVDRAAIVRKLRPWFKQRPVIIVDESFDTGFGKLLIRLDAQDYLDANEITPDLLRWRIDQAILRRRRSRSANSKRRLTADESACFVDSSCMPFAELSPRLQQVLDLFAAGHAPKRIAAILGTKEQTVRNQLAALREKLGVSSLQQLMIAALQRQSVESSANS